MMEALTFILVLVLLAGGWLIYRKTHTYLLNVHTHEVHAKSDCEKLRYAKKRSFKLITRSKALKLFKNGDANGCASCFSEFDTDTRKMSNIATKERLETSIMKQQFIINKDEPI